MMDAEKAGGADAQPQGRLSRQGFLASAGAGVLGATTVAAGEPVRVLPGGLEQARVLRERTPTTVTFYRSKAPGPDWMQDLITRFEQQNPAIRVTSVLTPLTPTVLMIQLSGGSSAVDLYQVDMIWPPVFASAGWVLPVDKWLSGAFLTDLLPSARRAALLGRTLYAFPQVADAGILVYRRDVLAKHRLAPPQTWQDLVQAARTVLAQEPGVRYGLLWQGAWYEGLFCALCELFWGNGGHILQHDTRPPPVVDTAQNRAALQFLVDTIWRDKIAPLSVTGDEEDDTRLVWEQGQVVFMRHWTNIWSSGSAPLHTMAQTAGMVPLPHGPRGRATACLGGLSLVINARSRYPDAAAALALDLTSGASQKEQAITARLDPTRASVYQDPDVRAANPWSRSVFPVLAAAQVRLGGQNETGIADRVTRQGHDALLRYVDVPTALANAQRDLAPLLGGTTP